MAGWLECNFSSVSRQCSSSPTLGPVLGWKQAYLLPLISCLLFSVSLGWTNDFIARCMLSPESLSPMTPTHTPQKERLIDLGQ